MKDFLSELHRKQLLRLCYRHFPNAKTNTINNAENNLHSAQENILLIFKKLLIKAGVLFPQNKIKNINYIFSLGQSVTPHEDEEYCSAISAKKAFLIILDFSGDKKKHEDFSDYVVSFFSFNKWHQLSEGQYLKFDPRKIHAMINNYNVKLLVVWV